MQESLVVAGSSGSVPEKLFAASINWILNPDPDWD